MSPFEDMDFEKRSSIGSWKEEAEEEAEEIEEEEEEIEEEEEVEKGILEDWKNKKSYGGLLQLLLLGGTPTRTGQEQYKLAGAAAQQN